MVAKGFEVAEPHTSNPEPNKIKILNGGKTV